MEAVKGLNADGSGAEVMGIIAIMSVISIIAIMMMHIPIRGAAREQQRGRKGPE